MGLKSFGTALCSLISAGLRTIGANGVSFLTSFTCSRHPRRRRFVLSLRTLFVVVTIFCCWLGWQVNAIHQWKALRSRAIWSGPSNADIYPRQRIPAYRLWLGDEEVGRLDVTSESEGALAVRLFPEATMILVNPGPESVLEETVIPKSLD